MIRSAAAAALIAAAAVQASAQTRSANQRAATSEVASFWAEYQSYPAQVKELFGLLRSRVAIPGMLPELFEGGTADF